MKAAILEQYGSVSKFRIKDISRPEIKAGQILVRNYASSVNPVDALVAKGRRVLATGGILNQIIGSDFSGVVISSKSRRFSEGDEVFGLIPAIKGGAYAEEIVVEEHWAAAKPVNLSFLESAVIPLVTLTAYQGMVEVGNLKNGDHILITGCTGGVGSAAVQLAKALNASVTGLCSVRNFDYAKRIGCDDVIDYTNESIPNGAKYDLVFDAAGKYTLSGVEGHLNDNAYFVTTRGNTSDFKHAVKTAVDTVFEKSMKFIWVKPDHRDLLLLKTFAENDQLKLNIAKTFTLEELSTAHQMMDEGGFVGKISISI